MWTEHSNDELSRGSALPHVRTQQLRSAFPIGGPPKLAARRWRRLSPPRAPSPQIQCWRDPPCLRWSYTTMERCRECAEPRPCFPGVLGRLPPSVVLPSLPSCRP